MNKYIISVVRTGYGELDFEVDAATEKEAQETALELALKSVFTMDFNWEVNQVEKIKPNTININGVEMNDCLGLHHDD